MPPPSCKPRRVRPGIHLPPIPATLPSELRAEFSRALADVLATASPAELATIEQAFARDGFEAAGRLALGLEN
jgi:hypothetical protein